jgi:hypothetical protein
VPAIEYDDLNQKAVLWPFIGKDRYGEVYHGDPEEIDVRWIVKKTSGDATDIDAVVIVDREVALDSLLWLGEYIDWFGTGSGGDDDDLMKVITAKETPDIDAVEVRRKLGVRRYKSSLPRTDPDNEDEDSVEPAALLITIGGVTDVACADCETLNGTHTAASTVAISGEGNWASDAFELCGDSWQWRVYHNPLPEQNRVDVSLYRSGVGTRAVWSLESANWDASGPIQLSKSLDVGDCTLPSVINIVGEDHGI